MSSTNLDERTLGALQREWKQSIAVAAKRPVTWADLDSILEDALRDRLALEARIVALEAVPVPMYRGTHQEGKAYPANSLITRSGSLWISIMSTTSVPGSDPSWKLVVKQGKA